MNDKPYLEKGKLKTFLTLAELKVMNEDGVSVRYDSEGMQDPVNRVAIVIFDDMRHVYMRNHDSRAFFTVPTMAKPLSEYLNSIRRN